MISLDANYAKKKFVTKRFDTTFVEIVGYQAVKDFRHQGSMGSFFEILYAEYRETITCDSTFNFDKLTILNRNKI